MLGDLGVGAILADDMGLGKTVQAIAMLASEREEFGADALGPTLVVCPMSVVKQWVAEIERFAPKLRVLSHHGVARLAGDALVEAARSVDVVVTSYDIATRDNETLGLVDVGSAAARRGAGHQESDDEACALAAPAACAAAGGDDGHADREPARRAVGDHGHRQSRPARARASWFDKTFAQPIEAYHDEQALERLRAIVQPFVLRRAKDSPEVELELPPITIEKDYCRLTVEQASLYQATVDRWLPRIEEQRDTFGQRGSVLAMLSQLKRVCNHPELLLPTGQALDGRSGKLDRLVELLELVPAGDKALVFTQYPGFDRLVPVSRGAARRSRSASSTGG